MILEMNFNNYRMFKGNNQISFCADARTKKLSSNYFDVLNKHVLKSVSLYGQNNSGKSNVLLLFKLIKGLMLGAENIKFNRELFGDTPKSSFSIIYKTNVDDNWMEYSFIYDSNRFEITKEELNEITYYTTGNSTIHNIYRRDIENGQLEILGHSRNDLIKLLPSKKPFIYCVSLDNNVFEPLKKYLDSFKSLANSIVTVDLYNIPMENTIGALKGKDENKKKFILEFIKHADLSVQDFYYNEKVTFTGQNNEPISEEVLKRINVIDQFKLFTSYGKNKVPSIMFDSTGTKKIEALASYVYEAIIEGKTLIVDELDNGLHFKLSRAILSVFNSFANNHGQLLFTAHDVELITCKHMMRKDQICFSIREPNGESKLFCLKDAPVEKGGPRTAEDLLAHYNRGEFGYVPSPNFTKILNNF